MSEDNNLAIGEEPDENQPRPRPAVLLLLDGWGIAPAGEGNAVTAAPMPVVRSFVNEYPVAALQAGPADWNRRYLAIGCGRDDQTEEVPPPATLSAAVATAGLRQLKICDSERFAALTYFFNGLTEERAAAEDWQVVSAPSGRGDKALADFQAVVKAAVKAVKETEPADLIVISISYLDLVAAAAAGRLEPVMAAAAVLDKGIKSIYAAVSARRGLLVISSAGGSAEQLIDLRTEAIRGGLTDNPVPLIIVEENCKGMAIGGQDAIDDDLSLLQPAGTLADIAPTILAYLGLAKPEGMTGQDLLPHVR